MNPTLEQVEAQVVALIRHGGDFDAVLRSVVAYQRAWNPTLAAYWEGRGFVGDSLIAEVPAVPTDVFQHVRLVSTEREATRVFRTSGTTVGRRGAHYHISTRAYDTGAPIHFKSMVMRDIQRAHFVMLAFDPARFPDSSLSHMAALLDGEFGLGGARYHVDTTGVHVADALAELAIRRDAPVVLLTTAFAAVALVDAMNGAQLALPRESVIIETGGFKGRSRVVEKAELYESLSQALGVPLRRIVSEYSMTELSSQLYDDILLRGEDPGISNRVLVPPHWCRVQVVDPDTLRPVPKGEVGIIRVVDLANVDSVVAIQTSDLGIMADGGVRLLGRAEGATPRGCSLAIEEIERRVGM